jgi:hypothetical protein
MFQLAVIIVIVAALILIQRNFSDAAASDDLSKLSKGKLKQSIAYARMIVKNNPDAQKRAEAAQTIERLQAEPDWRQAD